MFIYLLYKRKACGYDEITDVELIFNPTLVLKCVAVLLACLATHANPNKMNKLLSFDSNSNQIYK